MVDGIIRPKKEINSNFIADPRMSKTKLTKFDLLVASIYVLMGVFLWLSYVSSLIPQKQINQLLLAFTFGAPIALFLMYSVRFRIPAVTLLWLGISLLQWFLVNGLKKNPDFNSGIGSYADYAKNLFLLVVLVTIFRILSLTITKQEFLVAAWFSQDDRRKPGILDYIFTLAGLASLTILAGQI